MKHHDTLIWSDPGCQGLDPPSIALLAQHIIIQWIAASALLLTGQEEVAVHTPVTINVEAPIKSHHTHSFLLARCGHDRLVADRAPGGKPPVKILDTMDLVSSVYCEWYPIQALATHYTAEAVRVVWLARGS